MSALDIYIPGTGWRLGCKARVAPKCRGSFFSPVQTLENCSPCERKLAELKAESERRRLDREAPTPDDDPVTGFADMLTELEKDTYRIGVPKWF